MRERVLICLVRCRRAIERLKGKDVGGGRERVWAFGGRIVMDGLCGRGIEMESFCGGGIEMHGFCRKMWVGGRAVHIIA